MSKKHKHPEHENLERWLVSYADFITLLFATFVVLYALSQADLAKFKTVSDSIKAAFSPAKSVMKEPGGIMKGTPEAKILPKSGNSILDKVMPKDGQNAQDKNTAQQLIDSVNKINQDVQKLQAHGGSKDGGANLKVQERGIVISFASTLFFAPGSSGLKPEAMEALDKVAEEIKNSGHVVHVEGHTDNQPVLSALFPSNWELSAARASSVVRYFATKKGFDPAKLAAVGYGDTRPLADNSTATGRAKNRRVDIVLLFSQVEKQSDAGAAQDGEKDIVLSQESTPEPKALPVPVEPAQPKKIPLNHKLVPQPGSNPHVIDIEKPDIFKTKSKATPTDSPDNTKLFKAQ